MNELMMHRLPARFLTAQVRILLVGAGGTGSRILEKLVCLHRALIAKGHPYGLTVTVVDPDTVSPANIGRQAFYPGDVGCAKADVLVNRANMMLGDVTWESVVAKLDTRSGVDKFDMVIGASLRPSLTVTACRKGSLRGALFPWRKKKPRTRRGKRGEPSGPATGRSGVRPAGKGRFCAGCSSTCSRHGPGRTGSGLP